MRLRHRLTTSIQSRSMNTKRPSSARTTRPPCPRSIGLRRPQTNKRQTHRRTDPFRNRWWTRRTPPNCRSCPRRPRLRPRMRPSRRMAIPPQKSTRRTALSSLCRRLVQCSKPCRPRLPERRDPCRRQSKSRRPRRLRRSDKPRRGPCGLHSGLADVTASQRGWFPIWPHLQAQAANSIASTQVTGLTVWLFSTVSAARPRQPNWTRTRLMAGRSRPDGMDGSGKFSRCRGGCRRSHRIFAPRQ